MARVDAAGFAILHPLDILSLTLLSLAVTVGLLGLNPDAAALVGLYGATAPLVQHLSLKTPEWLAWFMQRPEAHLQHHEYGVHAGNYSDWPLLGKLFGTAPRYHTASALRVLMPPPKDVGGRCWRGWSE